MKFKTFKDLVWFLLLLSGTRFNYLVLEYIMHSRMFQLSLLFNVPIYEIYILCQQPDHFLFVYLNAIAHVYDIY